MHPSPILLFHWQYLKISIRLYYMLLGICQCRMRWVDFGLEMQEIGWLPDSWWHKAPNMCDIPGLLSFWIASSQSGSFPAFYTFRSGMKPWGLLWPLDICMISPANTHLLCGPTPARLTITAGCKGTKQKNVVLDVIFPTSLWWCHYIVPVWSYVLSAGNNFPSIFSCITRPPSANGHFFWWSGIGVIKSVQCQNNAFMAVRTRQNLADMYDNKRPNNGLGTQPNYGEKKSANRNYLAYNFSQ
jgi:hypothetical protein